MEKYIDDSNIHTGHRARMRAKLAAHGQSIFDDYELLEMLLYYVIPYRDTNPIAKNLLYAFGGLDGVLSADVGELTEVSGVGEAAAALISHVGRMQDIIGAEIISDTADFSSYESVGRYLADYFSGMTDRQVVALYLDSAMHLISMQKMYDLDFESGGVKARPFIDEAMKNHAAVVITAHNHPYGPFYPTPGDRETHKMITDALGLLGIVHAEHYIISGDCFAGIGCIGHFISQMSQMPALSEFMDTRNKFDGSPHCANSCRKRRIPSVGGVSYLSELFRLSNVKDPVEQASLLLERYRTVEDVITSSVDELRSASGETVAVLLKLLAYLTSRRFTDSFDMKSVHTSAEIAEYFKALFIGESVEKIYLMGFDSKNRIIGVRLLGEGTVNSSEVLPRKAMEAAVAMSAAAVSIAHNHPFGTINPSDDDVNMTGLFASMFDSCAIEFRDHYIVAGQLCDTVFLGGSEVE